MRSVDKVKNKMGKKTRTGENDRKVKKRDVDKKKQ